MRAAIPGDGFFAAIAPILAAARPLPHARLDTDGKTTRPKKQTMRMLKYEFEMCGYTAGPRASGWRRQMRGLFED